MSAGIKYDDGSTTNATQCFPVRTFLRSNEDDGGGAWLLSHRAEQRRRFKAVLCSKPKTFDDIKESRKRAEKIGVSIAQANQTQTQLEEMKHCHVEDPSDLCSVNICGQNLSHVVHDDLKLFDNVAYVNASENELPFDFGKNFPIVREIEMTLNLMNNLIISPTDYPHLEVLDLSYNMLSTNDLSQLGHIRNLKALHLSGNSLKSLPSDMGKSFNAPNGQRLLRYANLEVLMLDDNKLSHVNEFAALAGLKKLRHLNLARNQFVSVPELVLRQGQHVPSDLSSASLRNSRTKKASEWASGATTEKTHTESKEAQASSASADALLEATKEEIARLNQERADILTTTPLSAPAMSDHEAGASAAVAQETLVPVAEADEADQEVPEDDDDFTSSDEDDDDVTDDNDVTTRKQSQMHKKNPPPFAELRHLDLSYNQIDDEQGLLAVATFPNMNVLLIHDNPLTTLHSGDPPLLRRFLQNRFNIQIFRKRPGPLPKPGVEVIAGPGRTIDSYIPPVPRCDPDKLLAQAMRSLPTPVKPSLPKNTPLPPITPAAREEQQSVTSRPTSPTAADSFFMTQGNNEEAPKSSPNRFKTMRTLDDLNENLTKKNREEGSNADKKKASQYDILYSEEIQAGDCSCPTDVHGNVRALQYALNHPLVFKENKVRLDEVRPYVIPKEELPPPRPVRDDRQQQISATLHRLKTRTTVFEKCLSDVLDDESENNKKDSAEARRLLSQLHATYK